MPLLQEQKFGYRDGELMIDDFILDALSEGQQSKETNEKSSSRQITKSRILISTKVVGI